MRKSKKIYLELEACNRKSGVKNFTYWRLLIELLLFNSFAIKMWIGLLLAFLFISSYLENEA